MTPEDTILNLLRGETYAPMRADEIVAALTRDRRERKRLRAALNRLFQQGTIARVKQDRFCIPQDADLVTGVIRFKRRGGAVLIPDNSPANANLRDISRVYKIRAADTGVAMPDDTVMARIERPAGVKSSRLRRRAKQARAPLPNGDIYARVIRVVTRAREEWTGTLERSNVFYYVVADDPKIPQDILVPDPAAHATIFPAPRVGDKVVVKIIEWKNRHTNPVGEITEVLGKSHTPDAEFKAILRKYRLSPEFPESVLRETAEIPTEVRPRDRAGRLDCRDRFTFTIDPDDAKDFDDALSLETLPDGRVRVGVHIADVSAYVKRGSALDREAYLRGNSTYLVGMVIPMLPHALSNGLCSLVENEDRLTKSVFFTFDAEGRMQGKPQMADTVIRSNKRLSYQQAYALMRAESLDAIRALPVMPAHQTGATGRPVSEMSDAELRDLQTAIRTLWRIAEKLRAGRMASGALDLTMSEIKIYVDAEGYADRIEPVVSDESHELIEEYMLLANEAVARAFSEMSLPYLSRVHDEPDEEKLNDYRDYLAHFGILTGDLNNRAEVMRLLKRIKTHPQSHVLKTEFLRSMKQACYRASADGHYGLAKRFYAHFTSPIRRYSDLVAHRIFETLLERAQGKSPRQPYGAGELEGIAQHISRTERNSVDAERESVKVKLLEYFEREANRPDKHNFDAIITDVRNFGLFIELTQSQAYGLLPVSSLADDIYQLSPDGLSLVGRRTHRTFTLGQTIPVQVYRVDRFKREIDFTLAPDAEKVIPKGNPQRPLGQIEMPGLPRFRDAERASHGRYGRNPTPRRDKQRGGRGKHRRRR